MATATVSFQAESAKLLPSDLSKARAAYVERVEAACLRAQRRCGVEGMPHGLSAACSFLADAGVMAPASKGEQYFGWDLATSRRYLAGLDPNARAAEIEAGRKALFEGSNAVCPDIAVARRESAQIVDIMEARWAHNSMAYFARRDRAAMAANA